MVRVIGKYHDLGPLASLFFLRRRCPHRGVLSVLSVEADQRALYKSSNGSLLRKE